MRNTTMVLKGLMLLFALAAIPATGSMIGPLWWTRCVFNEVVARSREDPDLRGPALLLLRTAAEGRAEEISDEILKPFRIPRDFIETGAMNDLDGRVLAFDAIGRLASSEARGYLDSIDPKQFREEDQGRLSIVIRQARLELRLDEHADPQRRAEFLVGILRARQADPYTPMPTHWAASELCQIGAMQYLSEVEASLREGMPSPQREGQVQFCRDLMRVVSSKPDRTEALASALKSREALENAPLMTRMIWELGEARTKESWKALEDFMNYAEQMYGSSLHESPLDSHVRHARMYLQSRIP